MTLEQLLTGISPIDDTALSEYLSHWNPVRYERKEYLLSEGQVQNHLYYVVEGVQKSFFIRNGKEYVIAFTHDGSFCASPKSFYLKAPSQVFIECITESRLLRIHRDVHLEMLEKHPSLNTTFRIGAEMILAGVIDRYSELMALSIEDRFKSFASRSPALLNLIPHKDLASYLRIDATNFSKLMNTVRL